MQSGNTPRRPMIVWWINSMNGLRYPILTRNLLSTLMGMINPKFATSLKFLRLWWDRIWQFQVFGKTSPKISSLWPWISDRPGTLIIKRAFYSQIYLNCQTPFLPFRIFLGREAPLKIKWQTWVLTVPCSRREEGVVDLFFGARYLIRGLRSSGSGSLCSYIRSKRVGEVYS